MRRRFLPHATTHDALAAAFRWQVQSRFNVATAIDAWADGSGRTGIVALDEAGGETRVSFDALRSLSCRMANVLAADGIGRGDRVAILRPQRPTLPHTSWARSPCHSSSCSGPMRLPSGLPTAALPR